MLKSGSSTEGFDFVGIEWSPVAGAEGLQGKWSDGGTLEAFHIVAELGDHAANFAVASFGEDDFQSSAVAITGEDFDVVSRRFKGLAGFVGEPEPFAKLFGVGAFETTGECDAIGLGDFVAGVGETIAKLAIIGEQDETGRVGIETSDAEQPLLGWHEIGDDGASLRVIGGADHATGLINHGIK